MIYTCHSLEDSYLISTCRVGKCIVHNHKITNMGFGSLITHWKWSVNKIVLLFGEPGAYMSLLLCGKSSDAAVTGAGE